MTGQKWDHKECGFLIPYTRIYQEMVNDELFMMPDIEAFRVFSWQDPVNWTSDE